MASNVTSIGGSALNHQMRDFGGVLLGLQKSVCVFLQGEADFVNVCSKK